MVKNTGIFRSLLTLLISGILFLICFPLHSQDPGNPYGYLKGYNKYLKGEKFSYHSAQPNVSMALLVRSMEKEMNIEWETEALPENFKGTTATYIIMVAINVRSDDKHSWDMIIDGKKRFTITTPGDISLEDVEWPASDGFELRFDPVMIDRFGDVHGYMYLTVPAKSIKNGGPMHINVVGETANNRAFFIVYRYGMEPGINIVPEQAIRSEKDKLYQQIRVEYTYMGDPESVKIEAGDISTKSKIEFGYNSIQGRIPVVKKETPFEIKLTSGKRIIASDRFSVSPVIPRTIHLLHHSHVDIGYTHVQDEVKRIQWEHLENAIKYARESENNPEGARFRWNSEVMWPVESYLEENSSEKVEELKEAIRKGWIEIDGTYAHMLSELCNTEELIRLTLPARKAAKDIGVELTSAMVTDVPGWAWGMVPVLANSGIKYLSLGTNHGHRIGTIQEEWADRPFWWVSKSGEEKVLCWIHRNGYSMFHTGLNTEKMFVDRISTRIFDYLNQVDKADYPYEIVPVRYAIGADNGPPDSDLCNLVMEWNSVFESPKLEISTVSKTFGEFEKLYGDLIPSVSGAITGYWEDGAASSAKMTGLNRQVGNAANTISALNIIKAGADDIEDDLNSVWRKVALFDEHTWGSWNSISDPEDEFTLSQWAIKSSFARDGALESSILKDRILGIDRQWRDPVVSDSRVLNSVEVINTHSWDITGAVEISPAWGAKGTAVKDEYGNEIESQLLSSGHIYFIAAQVPAEGSRVYTFEEREIVKKEIPVQRDYIENDMFRLTVDKKSGAIVSLFSKELRVDLVDGSELSGLNSYHYVEGRSPENVSTATDATIKIIEAGELIDVMEVTSRGKGVNSIVSYYTLVKGVNKVYVTTVTDKQKIYNQEGVHLGFPFNVPEGRVTIDLALGTYEPGVDQAKGSCMNYYTPERWVDVSNQDYGVTLISLDAPMIEIGEITSDPIAYGWLDNPIKSQTIYSYIMNNYWETNYLAAQEGRITFRYVLAPHRAFSTATAEMQSLEESERLVVVPNPASNKGVPSLFKINNRGVLATSLIQVSDGYLVRLFNAGGRPEYLDIDWRDNPQNVVYTDFDGNFISLFNQGSLIPAWGVRTIKVIGGRTGK